MLQQVRAQRHDPLACLEIAAHARRVIGQAVHLDGAPGHLAGGGVDDPYGRPLAGVEDRADGHLQQLRGAVVLFDIDRGGGAQRGAGQVAFEHIPGLEGPGDAIRGVRQLSQGGRRGSVSAAIEPGLGAGTHGRAQRFGQMHDGLALAGPRQAHDRLSRADDLPRFGQRIDDDAVGVRKQHGVTRRVLRNVGLRFGRLEIGPRRVGGRLDLLVGRGRYRAFGNQAAIARFVVGRLAGACPGGGHGFALRAGLQAQVDRVQTHQCLAPRHGLPGVDQPLEDFARYAKTEIALDACRHHPGKRTRCSGRALHHAG
ncbi:hypothetical protein D3C85_939690 [compost metagenome]